MYYLLKIDSRLLSICANFKDVKSKKRFLQRELNVNKGLIKLLGLDNSTPILIDCMDDIKKDGVYCIQTSNVNIYQVFSYEEAISGYLFNSDPIIKNLYEYHFVFYKYQPLDELQNQIIQTVKDNKDISSDDLEILKGEIEHDLKEIEMKEIEMKDIDSTMKKEDLVTPKEVVKEVDMKKKMEPKPTYSEVVRTKPMSIPIKRNSIRQRINNKSRVNTKLKFTEYSSF